MTFHGLLRQHADAHPARVALISPDRQLTYSELVRLVDRVASGLECCGVGPRTVVVSTLPKGCRLVVTALATWRAGGVFAQVSARAPASWLRRQLDLLEPRLVVGLERHVDAMRNHGCDAQCVVLGQPDRDLESLYGTGDAPRASSKGTEPAYVNFSSGTTGAPKAVVATEHNVLANAEAAARALGLSSDDVHLCLFPAHLHPHEMFARGLLLGGTTVVVPSLRPRGVIRALNRWGVTALMAAPFFYELALRADQSRGLEGLRVAEAGGALSTPRLRDSLKRQAGVELVPVWGSTESTGVALTASRGDSRAHGPGFDGVPCPGYDARVVDSQLQLRGDGVALGYLAGRRLALRPWGEWFPTGDCFAVTPNGAYRFMGRMSGMIKVAGERVYPAEVEAALLSHPDVMECAVIGISDPFRGEVPAAAVVTKGSADPGALMSHCRKSLGAQAAPRRFAFLTELPRRAGGKVDVGRLRHLFDS
jgi:long-chain acyl-CoA synthetase